MVVIMIPMLAVLSRPYNAQYHDLTASTIPDPTQNNSPAQLPKCFVYSSLSEFSDLLHRFSRNDSPRLSLRCFLTFDCRSSLFLHASASAACIWGLGVGHVGRAVLPVELISRMAYWRRLVKHRHTYFDIGIATFDLRGVGVSITLIPVGSFGRVCFAIACSSQFLACPTLLASICERRLR